MQHRISTATAAVLALAFAGALPGVFASPLDDLVGIPPPETGHNVCHPAKLRGLTVAPVRVRAAAEVGDAPDGSNVGSMPTGYVGGGAAFARFPTVFDTVNAHAWGQPGARHTEVRVAWLGNATLYGVPHAPLHPGDVPPSRELDADAAPDEDVDLNFDGVVPDQDRHDESLLPATFVAGTSGQLEIRVSAAETVHWHLNVLVDWDLDGRWRNVPGYPPEWAVANEGVAVPAGHSVAVVTPPFVVGVVPGEPWVRVTLTPAPIDPAAYGANGWDGSVPVGVADAARLSAFPCGETEDHCGRLSVLSREDPTYNETTGGGYVRCVVGGDPEPPCDPATDPECCPPGADPKNCDGGGCDPRIEDCCADGSYAPCEECPDGSLNCTPTCDETFSSDVVAVSSGGVAATWTVSPWTGASGWGLDASRVRTYGITATIEYCNLEYGTSSLSKVASAPGTTAPGWRHAGSGYAMCSSGTHIETYPSPSGSGHVLDHGDYDILTEYWWGCPSPSPPGAGYGTSTTRVIVT